MSFKLNKISGEKYPLPRLMWADCDPSCGRTPVSIYSSKSEQYTIRPDLKPIPVAVIRLDVPIDEIDAAYNAVIRASEKHRRHLRTRKSKLVDIMMRRPRLVLSFLAQKRGMTRNNLAARLNCSPKDIVVETEAEARKAGFIK